MNIPANLLAGVSSLPWLLPIPRPIEPPDGEPVVMQDGERMAVCHPRFFDYLAAEVDRQIVRSIYG